MLYDEKWTESPYHILSVYAVHSRWAASFRNKIPKTGSLPSFVTKASASGPMTAAPLIYLIEGRTNGRRPNTRFRPAQVLASNFSLIGDTALE